MTALSIVCGILLMITGISCMFRPASTFFNTGYFMVILFLVYGCIGIVNVVKKKAHPLNLVIDIPAVILGVIAIFRPGTSLLFDGFLIYLFATWFVLQGAVSLYVSYSSRDINSGWFWGAILGVLGIILGVYSYFHPMVSVVGIGILVGAYLMQTGLDMIVLAAADPSSDGKES